MTELKSWFAERDVHSVECLVPDFQGVSKGKLVSVRDFLAGQIRLPEAIFGQDVTGGWCEDEDLFDVADVDMRLVPEPHTLAEQPWAERGAQCICDCETLEGVPLAIAPRTLLKNVVEKFHALGLDPVVAQEAEFYLVSKNEDPKETIRAPQGKNGRRHTAARSFQTEMLFEFAPFLERMKSYAAAQGVEMTALVQEMGAGQLEVNFRHGAALDRADDMFKFKRLVRQAAYDEGYYATFLAKPMTGAPGSAMHLHQSLIHIDGGANAFVAADGSPNQTFHAFIAGMQKYANALMPIFAPSVNSYRRFLDADSCPTNTHWGYDNRTTGFRVPKASPEGTRVENRVPGADTNPYLAIAASLASGYLGIQEKLEPTDPVSESAWDLDPDLPDSLGVAVAGILASDEVADVLGKRFVGIYADIKRRENEAYQRTVTAWEREHLMLTA